MKRKQWSELKRLFHASLELRPEERADYLRTASRGDAGLWQEATELLEAHERVGDFIAAPALASLWPDEVRAADWLCEEPAATTGQRVGRYEILRELGRGGMGEVYLAEDIRLGRKVALKLLPARFWGDQDRQQSFEQEARAASALNHPNILTIYEIGEADGRVFIATEYVDGQTLRQHMAGARMTPHDALDIAVQAASALAAAHAAGIVHRDVKPENIMVRQDGYVKVLDFGIAKLTRRAVPAVGVAAGSEMPGNIGPAVFGTVTYMSPERLRGEEGDALTDVWSLGVVLHEMIAGRRPFEGAISHDVIANVLTKEPEPPVRWRGIPAELEQVVQRCLECDGQKRYQSAGDLLVDLKNIKREIDTGVSRGAPRGKMRLSNLTRPQSTLAVGGFAVIAMTAIVYTLLLLGREPTNPPPGIKSVAVLPFVSLDSGEDGEALGLKLTDALIQRLGRLRQIIVRQTRAVQRYEGRTPDPLAAGREQGVDAVLDGSLQRTGEGLRVRVRLLRTSDGRQLWSGTFDESSTDPLVLQDALAEQTARALVPQLTGAERQLVAKRDTENVEANRLYTEGRYYWNKRNVEGIRKSLHLFQHAISLDPEYARAYAGLADSYITLSDYNLLPASEAYPKAREAAQKALEIDDTLGEAHTALAMIKASYDWDWSGADQAFRQAIERNPHYATAHQWYAEFLSGMGRHEEALEQIHQAQQLDPLSPIIQSIEAFILNYARDYDRAIAQCQRVISREPNFGEVYAYLGMAYERKGMFREAMDAYQQYSTLTGYNTREAAAIRASPVLDARDFWRKMIELAKPPTGSKFDAAQGWAQLGENDQALALLEQVRAERNYHIMYLKVHPSLDPLRADPRFQELLRSVNLAQ